MSYEGFREYLCANGHYGVCDAYDEIPPTCSYCGAPWTHRHSVDQTNGIEEDNPNTFEAGKECVGVDDDWKTDRHGNRYARDVPRYRPASDEWQAHSFPRK